MPTPYKPTLDYSYTAFQQAQGNNSFPGTQLDNDLANLKTSIDEVIDFSSGIIRSDGKLQNGVVTRSSLAEDLSLGLPAPRPWMTGRSYAADETATINNNLYICLKAHTSGANFSTDHGARFWELLIEFTVPASLPDDTISTAKVQNSAITAIKIADGAVTAAKIPNATVTAAKLAPSVGVVPIGSSVDWDGPFAPSGWLFKFGQAVSRTTYLALMDVLAPAFTAVATAGSTTLTGLTVDLRNLGLEGTKIEGSGLGVGATVVSVTATTLTMSSSATASSASLNCRVFPHGNGDGGSTFNVPDDRDRTTVGRGNMGGTPAGRISTSGAGTPGVETSKLGIGGGVDRHTLTTAQIPAHNHAATTTVFVNDPGHSHSIATVTINTGASGVADGFQASGSSWPLSSTPDGTNLAATGVTATATTTVNNNGGGEAHPNLPPVRVVNKIIFAGA